MSAKAKIDKSIFNTLVVSIKDTVQNSLIGAVRTGNIKLADDKQLENLLSVALGSIDAGYHKSSSTLSKQIDEAISTKK